MRIGTRLIGLGLQVYQYKDLLGRKVYQYKDLLGCKVY